MNIGERLNKFDLETDGTLKSFNELFAECPVKLDVSPESVLEVGSIVGTGRENVRYLSVDGKQITHVFERTRYFKPDANFGMKGNSSIRAKYILEIKSMGKTFKAFSINELAEVSGLSKNLISRVSQGRDKSGNYILTKDKMLKPKKVKPKKVKPKLKYFVSKDGKEYSFDLAKEVAEFLKVSTITVSFYVQGKWNNKDGWEVVRRRV